MAHWFQSCFVLNTAQSESFMYQQIHIGHLKTRLKFNLNFLLIHVYNETDKKFEYYSQIHLF